jgi:small subunit ribosomal protein S4e
MGRMGGLTKLKRQMAPAFWQIPRKEKRFALSSSPGAHPISRSYPLGIVLRDLLKAANTMHEAKKVVTGGEIKVDGVARYDIHFPIGLMDVLEIPAMSKVYRMVPRGGIIVTPLEVSKEEGAFKLCKVTRKTTVSGGKLQYGFHDGRTLLSDQKVNVNDTCVMGIPEQKIINIAKLEKGCTVLVISGDNAGIVGTIDDVRAGTFILPKRVLVGFKDRKVEMPVDMVMAVGADKPLIKLS